MKKVIILGSARPFGNTYTVVEKIAKEQNATIINLSDYHISFYDYEHKNAHDDFIPLIKNIIEAYDTIIFASPVYWYTMSAILKNFFDRISDLLTLEKETGRKLRGKNMYVVSSSEDNDVDFDYYLPFRLSAAYLGMNYLGNIHIAVENLIDTQKIKL